MWATLMFGRICGQWTWSFARSCLSLLRTRAAFRPSHVPHRGERANLLSDVITSLPFNGHDANIVVGQATPMIAQMLDVRKRLFQPFGV